jgi:tetratricopeptide (TPR) repeat protein
LILPELKSGYGSPPGCFAVPDLPHLSVASLSFMRHALLLWFAVFFVPNALIAQTPTKQPPSRETSTRPKPATKSTSSADEELLRRVSAAAAARSSTEPFAASEANKRVISLAVRQLAKLHMILATYPQSIALYQRSLDFEELPDVHSDLAVAELGAGRLDDALAEAHRTLAAAPDNARALTIRGRVLMAKGQFRGAAQSLSAAVKEEPELETLYSLGISYLSTRDAADKPKAKETFERMTKVFGDSSSLHVLFGRAYRDAQDMPGAIREFERAVALDPSTPHAHYFLGLAKLAVNEWKPTPEVRIQFQKELQFHPHDYLANYLLGFIASNDRDYDVSDRYLKAAAEIGANWPEPWLYLGINAYAQNDVAHAEEYLRKAVKLTGTEESRSNYQIRRAYVTLGRILSASGRAEESEMFLGKARNLQKKTMELTQQQISSVITEGGGTMAAVVPLDTSRESEIAPPLPANIDPFARMDATTFSETSLTAEQRAAIAEKEKQLRAILGLAFNDLATSEAVRGEFLAAVGHYQEAERWDATIQGLYRNLGVAAFRIQNYSEAIRAMSIALQSAPGDAPVHAMLGSAYFANEDFANAAKAISPLGERAMHDPVLGYTWAASLVRTGDLKQASQILEQAEKGQLPPDTVLLIGKLWTDIGDFRRAVESFHKALSLDPAAPRAHYFAGVAYTQWQKPAEALAEFRAQLALTPDDPETKNNLGYVLVEEGKSADAESLFRDVLLNHPSNGLANYQLGKILLDRSDVSGAVEHLESAAHALPDADYVHYQLQAAYRKASRNDDADRELQLYKQLKARNRQASIPRPSPPTP